ncbi:helix-turn-helix domain-containing protein [Citromicrobium bathyomarinum]|nr:helix-turn-helix domain-containing protein [Citromicrobium sp. JL2201]KPM22287.1 hypothetical protein VO57_12640 [Citromicrobium sp. JL2201]
MHLDRMHPEDVKAAIRKKYGTVARFVKQHDLPTSGVSDLFRGRTSARVANAVEKVLAEDAESKHSDSDRRGAATGKGAAAA